MMSDCVKQVVNRICSKMEIEPDLNVKAEPELDGCYRIWINKNNHADFYFSVDVNNNDVDKVGVLMEIDECGACAFYSLKDANGDYNALADLVTNDKILDTVETTFDWRWGVLRAY